MENSIVPILKKRSIFGRKGGAEGREAERR